MMEANYQTSCNHNSLSRTLQTQGVYIHLQGTVNDLWSTQKLQQCTNCHPVSIKYTISRQVCWIK